jgi:hypothetical protein
MPRKLKSGQLYMDSVTGIIGELRRDKGLFRPKRQWSLHFIASVMPADFNPGFVRLLKHRFFYIGDL